MENSQSKKQYGQLSCYTAFLCFHFENGIIKKKRKERM
ncbi:hypothetical protein Mahau_2683 [Mahella australiensis 50-1 BON]|uniref:Uncharacterized protein n=1 Tax=Mahella australiensis (strain DSM 15567 / CIP 107919 / 50-1 BON) TaxID=697281 RepID=F3ZYQ1_MAHA5|nr:hypothetical protein Mahau_2683 [Mahella australiensis 50-1 BON]